MPDSRSQRSTKPTVVVGTGNPHKVREISALLGDLAAAIHDAGVLAGAPDVDETGATFEENARLKAVAFARAAAGARSAGGALHGTPDPIWVVSDDSGLCVEALDGRPGVHSARYAATSAGENADSAANNRKLLRELERVPDGARSARFVCAVAVASVPAGPLEAPRVLLTVRGECRGRIERTPRGKGGFGYDPLFVPEGSRHTFAELPPREKNTISHRGRALQALRAEVEELLGVAGRDQ